MKSSIPITHTIQGRSCSGKDTAQFGADVLPNINVIAKRDLLTLIIMLPNVDLMLALGWNWSYFGLMGDKLYIGSCG